MDNVTDVSLLTRKQDKFHPTQLLVSILQPTMHKRNPTSLYAEISELLVFRKRVNKSEVDALQVDICAYKPYEFTRHYINNTDPARSIVVKWEPQIKPRCHTELHRTQLS